MWSSSSKRFRFDEQDLRYLRGLGQFSDEFLKVAAECVSPEMSRPPKGTVFFRNSSHTIIEAQHLRRLC